MHSDQIQRTWGNILASGLQERYGLSERDARTKVEEWLKSLLRTTRIEVPEAPTSRSKRRLPRQPGLGIRRRQRA